MQKEKNLLSPHKEHMLRTIINLMLRMHAVVVFLKREKGEELVDNYMRSSDPYT